MKVVIQRVTQATVTVDNKITGAINLGLLVLVGIEDADTDEDIIWLSNKIVHLRIFNDKNLVMNKSVLDIDGNILLIDDIEAGDFSLYPNPVSRDVTQINFAMETSSKSIVSFYA